MGSAFPSAWQQAGGAYSELINQALAETITWTGTAAPSGATNNYISIVRIGSFVFIGLRLDYANAANAVTAMEFNLPSFAPVPRAILGAAADTEMLYTGSGIFSTNLTTSTSTVRMSLFNSSSSPTGYVLKAAGTSGNYIGGLFQWQYFT